MVSVADFLKDRFLVLDRIPYGVAVYTATRYEPVTLVRSNRQWFASVAAAKEFANTHGFRLFDRDNYVWIV